MIYWYKVIFTKGKPNIKGLNKSLHNSFELMLNYTVNFCFVKILGMAEISPEMGSVSIAIEEKLCNGGTQTQPQEAPLLAHLKKIKNKITETQCFSHLPKCSAVNLEFSNLSYTINKGPCWKKRG